ncbi:MAG: diguanylate cyclase [Proteobacteria bacterium]|nr:diguanylate cyclase [Pseudomonadota bacterium]
MPKKPGYEELEARIKSLEKTAGDINNLSEQVFEDLQFLKIIIDTIPSPIFYKDRSGVYRHCNQAFSKTILGIDHKQIVGKSLFDLPDQIPSELADIYAEKDQYLFDNPGSQSYTGEVKCSDNRTRTFQFYKSTILTESREVAGIVGIMLDVTQFEERSSRLSMKNSELESLSYIDALTGIFNRRKFEETFSEQLQSSEDQSRMLNIAIIDIDFFKSYNDIYGHPEGDKSLKLVANIIDSAMRRPDDYAFRIGGEEFCLLFWTRDDSSAKILADRIRGDIEKLGIEHTGNKDTCLLTISMGLLSIRNKTADKTSIYEEVDKLLYKAKRSGRNQTEHKTV